MFVRNSNFYSDSCSERETTQRDFLIGIVCRQVIEPETCVISFAAAFVMLARTLPDAAKIDPQYNEASFVQRRSGTKNHFVMHCPAAERMRMQHQRHTANVTGTRLFQNGFQLPVRRRNENVSCWIHEDFRFPIVDCRFIDCQRTCYSPAPDLSLEPCVRRPTGREGISRQLSGMTKLALPDGRASDTRRLLQGIDSRFKIGLV